MLERYSTASFGKRETLNGLVKSGGFGVAPWVTNRTADEVATSWFQPVVLETLAKSDGVPVEIWSPPKGGRCILNLWRDVFL